MKKLGTKFVLNDAEFEKYAGDFSIFYDKFLAFDDRVALITKKLHYAKDELIFENNYIVIDYKEYNTLISNVSIEDAREKSGLIGAKIAIYLGADETVLNVFVQKEWKEFKVNQRSVEAILGKSIVELIYIYDINELILQSEENSAMMLEDALGALGIQPDFYVDFTTVYHSLREKLFPKQELEKEARELSLLLASTQQNQKESFKESLLKLLDMDDEELLDVLPKHILPKDLERFRSALSRIKEEKYVSKFLILDDILSAPDAFAVMDRLMKKYNMETVKNIIASLVLPKPTIATFLLVDYALKQTIEHKELFNNLMKKDFLEATVNRYMQAMPSTFVQFFLSESDAQAKLSEFQKILQSIDPQSLQSLVKLVFYIDNVSTLSTVLRSLDYKQILPLDNKISLQNSLYAHAHTKGDDVEHNITHTIDSLLNLPLSKEMIQTFANTLIALKRSLSQEIFQKVTLPDSINVPDVQKYNLFKSNLKEIIKNLTQENLQSLITFFVSEKIAQQKLKSFEKILDDASLEELQALYKINQVIIESDKTVLNAIKESLVTKTSLNLQEYKSMQNIEDNAIVSKNFNEYVGDYSKTALIISKNKRPTKEYMNLFANDSVIAKPKI
jgi:hypothetical protein